jgi:hypothetical protein
MFIKSIFRTKYNEWLLCVKANDKDFEADACKEARFFSAAMCPSKWVEDWDEQRSEVCCYTLYFFTLYAHLYIHTYIYILHIYVFFKFRILYINLASHIQLHFTMYLFCLILMFSIFIPTLQGRFPGVSMDDAPADHGHGHH